MAKLSNIWLNNIDIPPHRLELRVDWDNERHQAVVIEGLGPDDVEKALLRLARLIWQEQHNDHI